MTRVPLMVPLSSTRCYHSLPSHSTIHHTCPHFLRSKILRSPLFRRRLWANCMPPYRCVFRTHSATDYETPRPPVTVQSAPRLAIPKKPWATASPQGCPARSRPPHLSHNCSEDQCLCPGGCPCARSRKSSGLTSNQVATNVRLPKSQGPQERQCLV
jgi:hypothetical protein